MSAGGTAGPADARGIDAVLGGVGPHEARGTLRVLELRRIAEGGRGPMGDGEHGVARLGKRRHVHPDLVGFLEGRGRVTERGGPAAARNEYDPEAVRLRRIVDIQEERRARVHPIDHVAVHPALGARGVAQAQEQTSCGDEGQKAVALHVSGSSLGITSQGGRYGDRSGRLASRREDSAIPEQAQGRGGSVLAPASRREAGGWARKAR
jgi:hypothetical protein